MRTLFMLLLFITSTAFAEVSRDEAEKILDEMIRTNMISKEEADKARTRLRNMSASEWSAVNKEAEQKAAEMESGRSPASVSSADPTSDIDKAQLSTINKDLESISPYTVQQYKHPEVPQVQVEEVVVNPVVVAPVVAPVVEVPEVNVPEMLQ